MVLTQKQIDWAYEKYLDGYTKKDIAKSIGCALSTIDIEFDKNNYTKILPKLTFPEKLQTGNKATTRIEMLEWAAEKKKQGYSFRRIGKAVKLSESYLSILLRETSISVELPPLEEYR